MTWVRPRQLTYFSDEFIFQTPRPRSIHAQFLTQVEDPGVGNASHLDENEPCSILLHFLPIGPRPKLTAASEYR